MKLENQVCTIEQARKMKELGIVQESLFYHWNEKTPANSNLQYYGYAQDQIPWITILGKRSNVSGYERWTNEEVSAFTVAELGVMLPEEQAYKFFSTYYNDHSGNWEVEYRGFKTDDELEDWNSIEPPPKIYETEGDTEAQARAEMIIWLLENKIVSPGEINQRLQNS